MPTLEWSFESCPCEDCPTAAYCRRHLHACAAFANFVTYGGPHWRKESREPRQELYARIYPRDSCADLSLGAPPAFNSLFESSSILD